VGVERLVGVHPHLAGSSRSVEVGGVAVSSPTAAGGFHGAVFSIAIVTFLAGMAVYWLVRFAFVLLPAVIALALAALLLLPAVVSHPGVGDYFTTVLITGIVFCVVGLLLDARLHRREAFWWYVVGFFEIAVAFTYYLARGHHWVWIVLLVVAAAVLLASAPVGRAVWTSYAVLGIYAALAHYTAVATGSWRTTLVLTIVGLALVGLGVVLDLADSSLVGRFTRPGPRLERQPPP